MNKYHNVKFSGEEFALPKAGIGDNKYVAVFDPYSNVKMSRAAANDLYNKIKEKGLDKVDVVISAEVKGAAIAQRVADLCNTDLLIFRKKIKINFEEPVIAHVKTFTSGTNQLFIDKKDLMRYSGKTALFVDDVISTGSTINAIKDVLKEYNINVKAYCCVFKESDDVHDELVYVDTLPIFTD
ncbi:MAG: hypothetical protein IJ790_01710 [Lachnospiraceae bacterium]|nr:hypothetical protein [Lachnospiraceae bacterium]MBR1844428.1 hypothetical protein [Lachnospiraceae bacterium]